MSKEFTCQICKKEYNSLRSLSLHLSKSHKDITSQEYYDKYVLKNKEDKLCPICKIKNRKFNRAKYLNTCGDQKCINQDIINKRKIYAKKEAKKRITLGKKVCTTCGEEKSLNEFKDNKAFSDGKSSECIICDKQRNLNYKIKIGKYKFTKESKKKALQLLKEKSLKKCTCCKEIKNINEFSKDKYSLDGFNYRCKNCLKSVDRKDYLKRYRKDNKKRLNLYYKNKWIKDIQHNIKCKIRTRIRNALKNFNIKKSDKSIKYLGCSINYYKVYIELQFNSSMNWDLFKQGKIHIDHIIPLSKYNLAILSEQYKAFNWRNTKPMLAKDNLEKSDKFDLNLVEKYKIHDLLPI